MQAGDVFCTGSIRSRDDLAYCRVLLEPQLSQVASNSDAAEHARNF
jgi:hypothetical protein